MKQENNSSTSYKVKCETLASLARVYQMDYRTMKKMVEPLMNEGLITSKFDGRNLFTTKEVITIIKEIGPPPGTTVIYDD